MKKHLLILLALGCALALAASEYILHPIPTLSQLPVASIHTILQDREGYIWYGTRDGGLCRDNGYYINVFRSDRTNPALIGQSNYINEVVEGTNNRIIFSNGDGLFVLDKADYSISCVDEELRGMTIEPLLVARDSSLWASAERMIYHYDQNLQRIGAYPSVWKGESKYAIRMTEAQDGSIWASQWEGGIIRYDAQKDAWIQQYWDDKLIPTNIVEDAVADSFWVGTWGNGIVRYIPEQQIVTLQPTTIGKEHYANEVISMVGDSRSQRLYASTMYGLRAFSIENGEPKELDLQGIVPAGLGITDYLSFDHSGNLWVAGFPPHTYVLSTPREQIVRRGFEDLKKQLNNRFVVWNSVDEDDYVWLGLDRVLLCLYHLPTGNVAFANNAGIHNYLDMNGAKFSRCRQQKGIWSYGGHDLYHMWHEGMTIRAELITTVDNIILSIYDDGLGHLYIGHLSGLDCYDTRTGTLSHLPTRSARVKDIVRAKDGTLYYCSGNHHLACMDSLHVERIISEVGDFTSVAIAPDGIVWAADRQGDLLRYDPATGTTVIDEKGSNQAGNFIRSIAVDARGHLWLLTDRELADYDPSNGILHSFSTDDGEIRMDYFYNVSFNGTTVRVDGADALLDIIPPDQTTLSYKAAVPIITNITIDGRDSIPGIGQNKIDISPDIDNLEVQFSTLDHLYADKISYAYRIREMDNQWHYMPQGVNKASFVHLPKGHYTIEVMATNKYGQWGEPTTVLSIHRLPAWYETWWAYVLYALAIMAILLLLIRNYVHLQRHRQEQEMEKKLTELKFRFFTNVSHELRTPLTLILTPLQNLQRKLNDADKQTIQSQLSVMETNAQRLLSLVNRLLDFRKFEMGQQKLELSKGDFYAFVSEVCQTFQPLSREKSIGLGCAIPNQSLYIYFDKTIIQHLLSNLLSNAFKFTPAGGHINVTIQQPDEEHVLIQVSDTGCGIAEKDLPHIFDRFYQSTAAALSSNPGTGIGLNMVKGMVDLYQGTIRVESHVGKGTTFYITLPSQLQGEAEETKQEEEPTPTETVATEVKDEAATLLIVDDNDEFRQFLAGELAQQYHILQAADGEQALQVIAKNNVDLVISDVMMPNIDGMELCKRIKQDVSTSHIMVILLTARTAEEIKIEGFRAGTDDYLSKPFNMEMLELRIEHLLELRRQRNENFQRGEDVNINAVALNAIDQKFMADAMAAVERNMDNELYDVDQLASDVCMSRSTLYRKLVSLTGQKPTEFIRTIRLKKAAQLIREGNYSLTDIGYMCGFSSASYFYRCFKKQYGVQPGAYLK